MLRWILLGASFLLAGMAILTWVKAPNLTTWKIAILSDEFGHVLAILPVAVAIAAWVRIRETSPLLTGLTGLASVIAIVGFLRPVFSARTIAVELPSRLAQAFGVVELGRAPLEFSRLLAVGVGGAVKVESYPFSGTSTSHPLTLDFYRPESGTVPASARPCVITIHGGGWDSGDRGQLASLNHRLARRGYAVAAVSYGLAPQQVWPAQRQDILAAIAYLKAQAGPLGIDPGRFVLMGRSAGGQLATAVGYTAADPAIRGVIALYSPHDLHFAWQYAKPDDVLNSFLLLKQYLGGSPTERKAAYDESSGYLHVSPGVPPTLLVHGQLDTLVWHKQSERLAAKLAAAGVRNAFVSLPWGTHAFDFNPNGPGGQLSSYAIDYFLESVTR